jgi:hypothetical protein
MFKEHKGGMIRLRKGYVRMAHGFVVDNHTLGMR